MRPHGTPSRYNNQRCRCGPCVRAWAKYQGDRRWRLGITRPLAVHLAEIRAHAKHGNRHHYEVIGCRCDVCRAWARDKKRRYRARHHTEARGGVSHGPTRLEPAEAAYVESYRKDWARSDHIEARTRGRDILFRESRAVQACVSAGCFRVLDVGCNEGYFALAALRAGLAPTIMDLDAAIIESAGANLARHGFNPPPAITGLVEHLGTEHGTYDAVVCMEVVEHLPNPAGAVRRMKYRARRLLVLTTPVGNCYDDPLHLHHWKDEDELAAGLGLDGQFRSCSIERIQSREGDSERVFLVQAEV